MRLRRIHLFGVTAALQRMGAQNGRFQPPSARVEGKGVQLRCTAFIQA
jgi:hypothetical protein